MLYFYLGIIATNPLTLMEDDFNSLYFVEETTEELCFQNISAVPRSCRLTVKPIVIMYPSGLKQVHTQFGHENNTEIRELIMLQLMADGI